MLFKFKFLLRVFAPALISKIFFLVALAVTLLCCNPGSEKGDNKFRQYYVQGQKLYNLHCSNCHQETGTGLGRLYPPLKNSDYLHNNLDNVLCLMRHGIDGEILVNGIQFNKRMPGIETLTDLEIAEIATFIYNSWGNEGDLITVQDASAVLSQCKRH